MSVNVGSHTIASNWTVLAKDRGTFQIKFGGISQNPTRRQKEIGGVQLIVVEHGSVARFENRKKWNFPKKSLKHNENSRILCEYQEKTSRNYVQCKNGNNSHSWCPVVLEGLFIGHCCPCSALVHSHHCMQHQICGHFPKPHKVAEGN